MQQFQFDLKNKYNNPRLSDTVNKYFKTSIKLEKCRLGIAFILRCLHHEKLPNFSRVNLATSRKRNNEKQNQQQQLQINNIREQITLDELRFKNKEKKQLSIAVQQLQDALVFDRDLSHDNWSKLTRAYAREG